MSTSSSHGLNDAQYQAVHHRNGPLLVLAGAGSGKTRVITERIAGLIERDVPEHAITAVTFTNKAAKEMRERLLTRLGDKARGLRICTFHALGLAMVREHAELVGRKANVSVFAGSEQKTVMRSVLTELKLAADADQVDRMVQRISSLKSGLLESHDNQLAAIREAYDALLEKMNAVDFDDLLVMPVLLMTDHAEVRAVWRERARYFLVDEYQDSSRIQYQLIRLLVPDNGNLTVVGDDDQSIYGWRGAEVKNLFQLERDYSALVVVRLEENYRSTGSILQASNSLIAKNSERLGKTLRSTLGEGKPIRVWGNVNPEEEGRRLAGDIKSHHARTGGQWDAYCVLYRASFLARPIELGLREAGIPYHVTGGMSFFDRAEIQDTLAYLRLIANVEDDLAFLRAIARPRRGIGSKALGDLGFFAIGEGCSLLEACLKEGLEHKRADTLREFGEMIAGLEHQFRHGEPDDAFDAVLDLTRLEAAIRAEADDQEVAERRMSNVLELRRWWIMHTERGGDLAEFIQHIFLMAEKQDDDPTGQVRLMTVHAAKGLEFDQVYVIGMEDGIFPHRNALEENRMEEERRLMYVAMTRARFVLTLSYVTARRRFGLIEKSAPSPFLKEPDQSVLRWVDREVDSEDAREEAEDHMAAMRKMLGLE
ncbi:MAG: UvrD-helicase domain-containing protein [Mariprofundus sp.]